MAASCSASTLGLKANQIFFMKNFMDDDGDVCIFDLETNTQEITRVHNREDLILCRKPFWIVPPSQLAGFVPPTYIYIISCDLLRLM